MLIRVRTWPQRSPLQYRCVRFSSFLVVMGSGLASLLQGARCSRIMDCKVYLNATDKLEMCSSFPGKVSSLDLKGDLLVSCGLTQRMGRIYCESVMKVAYWCTDSFAQHVEQNLGEGYRVLQISRRELIRRPARTSPLPLRMRSSGISAISCVYSFILIPKEFSFVVLLWSAVDLSG